MAVEEKDIATEVKETIQTEDKSVNARKMVLKTSLEKKAGLKTFVIGVGNAGNQTVVIGSKEGLDVYAVNTSIIDLSDIVVDDTIPSFIIGKEGRGSGKNIEKGKALLKENVGDLFKDPKFRKSCQEADVIVVVSATGGGTGPSVSPELCRILKSMYQKGGEIKKFIIYHGIVPRYDDSNMSFANTAYCLNEIRELNIPYMLTDLNRVDGKSIDEIYKNADLHAVRSIKAVVGGYCKLSKLGMIDENDNKTILSEPGYMAAYFVEGITSSSLENRTLQSYMIDEIKKGPAVMIQKDGISMHFGSILDIAGDIEDVTKQGEYNELFEFIGHKPKKGIYENVSVTDGTSGKFIAIFSGMTYPINQMEYYTESVKRDNEFIKKQKEINTSDDAAFVQSLVSGGEGTNILSSDTAVSDDEMDDVLAQYLQ